jgi:hypothetical protein
MLEYNYQTCLDGFVYEVILLQRTHENKIVDNMYCWSYFRGKPYGNHCVFSNRKSFSIVPFPLQKLYLGQGC